MKRSKHSLSHYRLITGDMGRLIPIGLIEALPGDTFQHSTSLLLRMSPMLAPVMHPVSVRVHHWFVPNRLVFPDWEKFITGGSDGLGEGAVYPTTGAGLVIAAGSLGDYFGIRPATYGATALNLMPMQGYAKIYNEFYRDEDLVTALAVPSGVNYNSTPLRVAWEKDYFTSARPWTQKGPAVTLPLGTSATVKTNLTNLVTGAQNPLRMLQADGGAIPDNAHLIMSTGDVAHEAASGTGAVEDVYPSNLFADLTGATAAAITDIRRAFGLQRYQEARAQYGSRYTEYLRYLGITPSDARLQRPEYLGGGKQTVAFSEVLRTGNVSADNATLPIGQLKGHGIAAMRSNRYRYFCEEHGYIFTLLSVRPRSIYVDGNSRTFYRRTKEDYFQKELELIGQQEIEKGELFASGTVSTDAETFGYQDRYAEYRHQYSGIAGDFRSTLDYWHLARKFASLPTLNQSFIECDPTKRIFAEQTQHSMWIMVSHSIQARRLVGRQTIGRVI